MSKKDYWVYILLCENESYYTGYTDNLERRYRSHVNGTGKCKYTRSFKPVTIAQSWLIDGDKILAMQLEREIKKKTREQKIRIIKNPETLSADPRVRPIKPELLAP
ncbi:GIY-YIG nuclease family protein [Legionella shakespearei]|uniref:Nuclease n=1 Tax=Legionella shakespearei DSM 23087 TaxID=1122169 RepID=A0A0W0Z7I2_9GAMM|nr:GIY-YIG nuclease family protein [Legionella shakespearei]KTD65067.1 nuclease [Legionella shakespearei DSM 23087]